MGIKQNHERNDKLKKGVVWKGIDEAQSVLFAARRPSQPDDAGSAAAVSNQTARLTSCFIIAIWSYHSRYRALTV